MTTGAVQLLAEILPRLAHVLLSLGDGLADFSQSLVDHAAMLLASAINLPFHFLECVVGHAAPTVLCA
jgi:hypothetical protein